jgi:hypothetical protein
MAIPVPKTMALPIPCIPRNRISNPPEGDSAQRMEERTMIMLPMKKILFRPLISASLPIGTRNTAEERRKAMATQLIPTAPIEKVLLMAGSAILMAAPRKGFIKEVMRTMIRINLLEAGLWSVIRL